MFVKLYKKLLKCKICFYIIFIILLISSCNNKKTDMQVGSGITIVKTANIEKRKLNNDLNSFGTISFKTKNNITALVEGTIDKLYVKEGDVVKKGQALAILRNVQLEIQKEQAETSYEAAKVSLQQANVNLQEERMNVQSRMMSIEKNTYTLEQLQLELNEAKTLLENNRKLHSAGGITDSALKSAELSVNAKETEVKIKEKEIEISRLGFRDEDLINNNIEVSSDPVEKTNQFIELNTRSAKANVENQQAAVKNAEKNLALVKKLIEELIIKSPVNGVVGAIYFENGEFVPQNEKLLTLMDISEVNAVFSIQEQDINYFKKGDSLTVDLPALGKSIQTKISEISPIADSTSGNFTVKALIPNISESIKPGMFVKCTVPRKEKTEYLCIPETTIIKKDGDVASVFVIVNGFIVLKQIIIKEQKDGYIWIDSGLKDNDTVVNKPSPFLKEGEKVEIH